MARGRLPSGNHGSPGRTFEEIAAAEYAVANGREAERPFVLVAQPTLYDPSRAPEGKHVLWAYCHVPNGSTFDMTERIEAQIERFAPGFRDCILARHVSRPRRWKQWTRISRRRHQRRRIDAAARCSSGRLCAATRRAHRNLYLCSASTPPGGGVHGMCGYHAAQLRCGD